MKEDSPAPIQAEAHIPFHRITEAEKAWADCRRIAGKLNSADSGPDGDLHRHAIKAAALADKLEKRLRQMRRLIHNLPEDSLLND